MPNKTTHVVPNKDGGWNIKQSGASRNSGHFDNKMLQLIERVRLVAIKKVNYIFTTKTGK